MRTWKSTKTYSDPRLQRLADWTAMMLGAAEGTALAIGCSPEAIVAQAALESAWGAASIGNNVFGIKAGLGWTGARHAVWTREVIDGQEVVIQDWFRDYPSVQASIEDHFAFLRDNGRYRAAGVFDAKTDLQYFQALQRAGYATDPHYADRLMDVLRTVHGFAQWVTAVDVDHKTGVTPRLLMTGCEGTDVAALQRKLGLPETGTYDGELTRQVIAYQRDHELSPDGIVGPLTRATLGL